MSSNDGMSATDWVAIYAAVVATAVLIWDVYKWWRSERLSLGGFTTSNMKTYGSATTPETEGKTYTLVRIRNRGSVPCVVQMVVMTHYKNLIDRWRGKVNKAGLITHSHHFGPNLPYKLEKGDEFSSGVLQNEEFEQLSRQGRLYLGVTHTMAKRPFLVRVQPIILKR